MNKSWEQTLQSHRLEDGAELYSQLCQVKLNNLSDYHRGLMDMLGYILLEHDDKPFFEKDDYSEDDLDNSFVNENEWK